MAGLGQQLLLLAAQDTHPYHFVAAQRHLAAASGTTPNVAVVANVSDAIGKFCLEANVARGIQIGAHLTLLLPDCVFEDSDLVLFAPAKQKKNNEKWQITVQCTVNCCLNGTCRALYRKFININPAALAIELCQHKTCVLADFA